MTAARDIHDIMKRDYPRLYEILEEYEPCALKTEVENALREIWNARHFIGSSIRKPER